MRIRYGISRPPQLAARRAKRRLARNDMRKRRVSLAARSAVKLRVESPFTPKREIGYESGYEELVGVMPPAPLVSAAECAGTL
jgi:hypothetical protein